MTPEARWRTGFAVYVVLQLLLRVLIGPALELDEAEAFVFGQELALGYGPQPPLYFWIQRAVFGVLGESVLGLAVVKAAILAGTLLVLFEMLRREIPTAAAGAATLSLGFLFQVVYESQRSFTHSSMALLAAVLMAATLIRALRTGRWTHHVLFGLAMGVGLLSKLNVAIWALALVLAVAAIPEWRRRLRAGPLLAAVGVALALNGPVAAWMLANPDLALRSTGKFEVGATSLAPLIGLGALALAALSFNSIGLLAVGLAWRFGRAIDRKPAEMPSAIALLGVAAGLSLALVALGILVSGTTEVRDRWLMPLSWPVVPVAVAWIWPVLTERARRILAGAAGAFWIVAAVTVPYASLVDPGYRGSDWTGMETVLRAEGAGELPILATNTWAAGNLMLRAEVPAPQYLARIADLPPEALILIVPTGSEALRDPLVEARIRSAQDVDVPRGIRVRSYVVLQLSAR